MSLDLSKTSTPRDFGALMPGGTVAPMQVHIKSGGYGESGLLTPAETAKGRSAYLHLEFIITAGPHKDRKLWTRSTVEGDTTTLPQSRSLATFSGRWRDPPSTLAPRIRARRSRPSSRTSTSACLMASASSARSGLNAASWMSIAASGGPTRTPSSPASPRT
jgi:hypothetical protein